MEASNRLQQVNEAATGEIYDLIVVGSGLAGITAALTGAQHGADVLLLTAGEPLSGSSAWAQGGIAAALGVDDTPEAHAQDTLAVGGGLNDRSAVATLTQEGIGAVRALIAAGVPFAGAPQAPELALEAGHRVRRILHANGGATGRAVVLTLLEQVRAHPHIHLLTHARAEALLKRGERVSGVRARGRTFGARAVVLTTGGYAALWPRTTNSTENRGDGLALAYHAGAALADLEFVQFHPTALALPGQRSFLLSEALRGEGAQIVDAAEQPLVDPLLPRDQLARVVSRLRRERGAVYLSLRHLEAERVHRRFASLAAQLEQWGLDLARDLLPIAPAAHYCMGGIRTDLSGRSSVPGLYAAGEAACTGVQGANRLASNSLLECLVFGARAAEAGLADTDEAAARWQLGPLPEEEALPKHYSAGEEALSRDALGELLETELEIERSAGGLRRLVERLPEPATEIPPDGLTVAALAARAALLRRESRGAHFRSDAPVSRRCWQGRIVWEHGRMPQFEEVHG